MPSLTSTKCPLKQSIPTLDVTTRFNIGRVTGHLKILFWEDSVIEHGDTARPSSEYADWAIAELSKDTIVHTHQLTSHSCVIEGDTNHKESYVILAPLGHGDADGQVVKRDP